MDCAAEERFVRTYIRKNRRERLLYELTAPKKRYAGLERFCHGAGDLLDPEKIRLQGDNPERQPLFEALLRRDEACVLLSPDPWLDGRRMRFSEAWPLVRGSLDAVILLGPDFAVVRQEAMPGGQGLFLLTEDAGKQRAKREEKA